MVRAAGRVNQVFTDGVSFIFVLRCLYTTVGRRPGVKLRQNGSENYEESK